MKKSIMYLLIFCLAFCMIFTACATRMPQNTDDSQSTSGSWSTSGSQSTSDSQSTTESKTSATEETTSQQTTEQSSATETTTEKTVATTHWIDPYLIGHTVARERKELQTEVPELQEKIDRNDISSEFPVKLIVQIGDQRDVPYIFRMGGGMMCGLGGYVIYPYFAGSPYFREIEAKKEYIPTYTYTGTETLTIELDDEDLDQEMWWKLTARYFEGDIERYKRYDTLQEMYEDLPKGTYYVHTSITLYGNHIYGVRGNYIGQESTEVVPVFILELK